MPSKCQGFVLIADSDCRATDKVDSHIVSPPPLKWFPGDLWCQHLSPNFYPPPILIPCPLSGHRQSKLTGAYIGKIESDWYNQGKTQKRHKKILSLCLRQRLPTITKNSNKKANSGEGEESHLEGYHITRFKCTISTNNPKAYKESGKYGPLKEKKMNKNCSWKTTWWWIYQTRT